MNKDNIWLGKYKWYMAFDSTHLCQNDMLLFLLIYVCNILRVGLFRAIPGKKVTGGWNTTFLGVPPRNLN